MSFWTARVSGLSASRMGGDAAQVSGLATTRVADDGLTVCRSAA